MNRLAEATRAPESIRWRDGRLWLLDQRRLPDEVIYEEATSAADVAAAIARMTVSSTPAVLGSERWVRPAPGDYTRRRPPTPGAFSNPPAAGAGLATEGVIMAGAAGR